MKNIRATLALFVLAAFLAQTAHATTSTVNPNVPAQNAPLSSSALRAGISLPAYNDINTLFSLVGGGGGGTGTVTSVTFTGDGVIFSSTPTSAVTTAGTLAPPLLTQTANRFLAGPTTGSAAAPTMRAMVAADLPLSSALTFTGLDKFNLNAAALPAGQSGTVLQLGAADAAISRIEVDAFGNTPHFSTVRWDGTNASPTAIQSADALGSFNFWGYNGTAVVGPQAAVRAFANQNWAVGANGSYVDIAVTPNGSTTLTQVLKFENDGGITTPSVTGGDKGAGTINAAGFYVNGGAIPLAQGGTAGVTAAAALSNVAGNPAAGTYSIICASGISCTTTTAGAGGGGSGTVNTGTTPDLSYYATSTTAVSDATGLQYNTTTKGLNLNGVNAHSLPDNGLDTTGVAIGASALLSQTVTGANNTAVGALSGSGITSGTGNVVVGYNAGHAITTSTSNVLVGQNAGIVMTTNGGSNSNTLIGNGAGQNETGTFEIGIGNLAMGGNAAVSGIGNIGIGGSALGGVTGGGNGATNIGIGANVGQRITTGSSNTMIGVSIASSTLATGSSNILLGSGAGIDTPAASTSNYLNIGNMIAGDISKGILIFRGPTTVLGSCGTSPTLSAGSNDMAGEVTTGTSTTSCVVSFANTHTSAPKCVVTPQASSAGFGYTISTTALTVVATALGGIVFDYVCPNAATATNPVP